MNYRDIYNRAVDLYGVENQLIVANEELAELGKEICKHLRGIGNRENLIEELADVVIMCDQLKMICNCDAEVDEEIAQKMERLERNIEKDSQKTGICDRCAFRKVCTFPKEHPDIKLKCCGEFMEG